MAKRQFQVTNEEYEALAAAERVTRNTYELKRLQAVRLYGSGLASESICEMVGCTERTIRAWVQRYQDGGIEGLRIAWNSDNALKLSRAERADLKEKLAQYRPDQVLSSEMRFEQGMFWTVSDLRLAVAQWYGVSYRSEDSYVNLLHECGLSYQRAERVYRSQPKAAVIADFEEQLEKK